NGSRQAACTRGPSAGRRDGEPGVFSVVDDHTPYLKKGDGEPETAQFRPGSAAVPGGRAIGLSTVQVAHARQCPTGRAPSRPPRAEPAGLPVGECSPSCGPLRGRERVWQDLNPKA
ncbi:unnamed protein product, partial [Prorocentrum cordatum]